MDTIVDKPRLAALLKHFSSISDPREQWRVAHPLNEILLLVVCGTICSCDDYEDIVEWGEARIEFLREFLPYYHGIPCADWLRTLLNRIDPKLFSACFTAWAQELCPDAPELVAIDGKTARRTHDRGAGKSALHLISAFATNQRLVLSQEAVADKSCEQVAIPELVGRMADAGALGGALVTIDAIACNPAIAASIRAADADYLLAVKGNQPTLCAELEAYFADARADEVDASTDVDKDHGRLETRRCVVSRRVDWMSSDRRFPGDLRFPDLKAIIMIESTVEIGDKTRTERRFYISSGELTAKGFAKAIRSHWQIENSLHWVLDVQFKEDLSRLRKGHGAKNMAVVRHFALNILRSAKDKRSIKTRRKRASWNENYLRALLNGNAR